MTLNEAMRLFVQAGHLSALTRVWYRACLTQHVNFLDPDRHVADISPLDIDAWADDLRSQNLARNTIGGRMRCARTFWNWLVERKYIESSPFRFRIPAQHLPPLHSRALRRADRAYLLEAAKYTRHPERDFALLRLLADTGCRLGALIRLRVRDLDLERRCVLLQEKGDKQVLGYFGPATAEALGAWLAVRPALDSDALFVSQRGGPFTREGVRVIIRRLAKAAGVTGPCMPHSWRHLCGQSWADEGIALPLIQAKLGHSSVQSTLRYLNQDEERLRAVTDRLSALF